MSEKFLRSPIWSLVFVWAAGIIYILMTIRENGELANSQESLAVVIMVLLSAVVFVLLFLWSGLISRFNKKNPQNKISVFTVVPIEFRDEDEGMQWLTNRACRKVYMFFWSALPLSYIVLFIFPDIEFLPILIIMGLATGQYLIYWREIRKADREQVD